MKRIGIVAHSAEGAALSFQTVCREGQARLGEHMHPEVVLSAIPMGLSMDAWLADDYDAVGFHLRRGVEQVAAAGADFFLCPDNTAHIALERIADSLPIAGLHIAEVVAHEVGRSGWARAGILGTKWTMTGRVYPNALERHGLAHVAPDAETREALDAAIFDELCQGVFRPETTARFQRAIDDLADAGADCAILGCTEIPLIITPENSSLPVLDSTRLQARYAVAEALSERPLPEGGGWLPVSDLEPRPGRSAEPRP